MKIAVVMETKDRRLMGGENYVLETLDNLTRTGFWQSPHLHSFEVVSGGEQDESFAKEICTELDMVPFENMTVTLAPPDGITRQQNAARAIRLGAETDADFVMKLEDDLDFVNDFLDGTVRWLEKYRHLPTPMFSLGATFDTVSASRYAGTFESVLGPGLSFPYVRKALAKGKDMLEHPVLGYWGAQALVWPVQEARELGRWLGPDPYLDDGREQHRARGHDLLLQVWGQWRKARSFAVAIPAFVQHIGKQSTIQNPFFQFPWPGRRWSYK